LVYKVTNMKKVVHNLPEPPYTKFFGRQNTIKSIIENLLEGNTYIVSIDGVGGIGKTALAYHFCKEYLIEKEKFDYIVWLTAKETVFDAFSEEKQIKEVKNEFKGITTLVDTTLETLKCEELLNADYDTRKAFFEDIISNNSIFFVLDNLENVQDNDFFEYITKDFNRIANTNRKLKVLTTSRKRKKIIDFPIEIEGLNTEDALTMLKYLAERQELKEITNQKGDHTNIGLIEKVARIPLGIEFIIGQMALGKSKGQIFEELEGYPSLDQVKTHEEKKKRLSDIILFSFKDMYETLSEEQQFLFMVISALQRNKKKDDVDISFELLMSITKINSQKLSDCLDTLISHKLISEKGENNYFVSQMAINFSKQFYSDFEKIEDKVVGLKNEITSGRKGGFDSIEIFLEGIRRLVENSEYGEAENELKDILGKYHDYRLYFQLAKIQRITNNYVQASDNFRMATELNPKDHRAWVDWVNMEHSRGRNNIAFEVVNSGLRSTNNEISLGLLLIEQLYYKGDYNLLRKDTKELLNKYNSQERKSDRSKLLEKWTNYEYSIYEADKLDFEKLFEVLNSRINCDITFEERLEIYKLKLKAIDEFKGDNTLDIKNQRDKLSENITSTERSIYRSISSKVKNLNWLISVKKDIETAKKDAKEILYWSLTDKDSDNIPSYQIALRQLLQIFSGEGNFSNVIKYYEEYISFSKYDDNCNIVYNKARRENSKVLKTEIIKDILSKITECEMNLRRIVLTAVGFKDDSLSELVRKKGKEDWLDQWKLTKKKALSKDESIIHYSDLNQLKSVFIWVKPDLIKISKHEENKIRELISEISNSLEKQFTPQRNESFHSRLELLGEEGLNEVKVDIRRISRNIISLKSLILKD